MKLPFVIRNVLYDLECGIHSKFKPCCILWFSFVSTPSYYYCFPLFKAIRYSQKLVEVLREPNGNFYHIPCPICLILNRQQIAKSCPSKTHYFNLSKDDIDKYWKEYLSRDQVYYDNLDSFEEYIKILKLFFIYYNKFGSLT